MITPEEFETRTGRAPTDDDLTRVNCHKSGSRYGHLLCGWCDHSLPVFMCEECTFRRVGRI